MIIMSIDAGYTQSACLYYDTDTVKIIDAYIIENEQLIKMFQLFDNHKNFIKITM